jgi:hypothetical protein
MTKRERIELILAYCFVIAFFGTCLTLSIIYPPNDEPDPLLQRKETTDSKVAEKPCGHLLFNRYCQDCWEWRDKYGE